MTEISVTSPAVASPRVTWMLKYAVASVPFCNNSAREAPTWVKDPVNWGLRRDQQPLHFNSSCRKISKNPLPFFSAVVIQTVTSNTPESLFEVRGFWRSQVPRSALRVQNYKCSQSQDRKVWECVLTPRHIPQTVSLSKWDVSFSPPPPQKGVLVKFWYYRSH